ncbi:MAG: response regulator [Anaerolineae bacterium]|nr:response regulator [Anaerolineae bacterium]
MTSRKATQTLLPIEHAALVSIGDGIVIGDTDGRVLTLNRVAARLLHLAPDEAVGRPIATLFEPFSARGRVTIAEAMKRLYADPYSYGQASRPAEIIFEIGVRFIQAQLSPILSEVGEFMGVVIVLRDITREVEAERARSDFVSNVSHELRLPLTAIKGYCDLLLHDLAGQLDDEHLRYLRIVQSNADHLVALINDLMDISRVESYRLDLEIQPVQLDAVIRDVADMVKPQCDQKGLRLTVDVEPNAGPVLGDRNRLSQAISNLVSYACHRTPEGGHITLALSSSDEGVQVSVSDTAPRFSSQDRSRIFQPFYRPEDTIVRDIRGTGLELPVARMLVEMHGGRIWAAEGKDGGNTIAFVLPRCTDLPGEIIYKKTDASGRQYTILVVEDDEDIAQLISLQLRREGFHVLTTAYGEEAVSLAHTQDVDLITLDMMLPDISGIEVLHRLKSDPATAEIPVIIVSVLLPEQTGEAGQEAADHITKPFAFEKLMESIRRTLEAKRERRISSRVGR